MVPAVFTPPSLIVPILRAGSTISVTTALVIAESVRFVTLIVKVTVPPGEGLLVFAVFSILATGINAPLLPSLVTKLSEFHALSIKYPAVDVSLEAFAMVFKISVSGSAKDSTIPFGVLETKPPRPSVTIL